MKIIRSLALLLMLASTAQLPAQNFISDNDYPVNGYSGKIAGTDYEYPSCIPNLRESLLIRATDGKDFLEWETDAVPSVKGKSDAAIIWVAGMGGSPGKAMTSPFISTAGHHGQ